ncbi:MAG: PAS domain-containing protein [Myxococcales bacterium]|nr:PAS domain-containing protein [Myxococcales bacterium]
MNGPDSGGSAFQQSELEQALETARVGVWRFDASAQTVLWSPQCAALFGRPARTFRGTFEDFASVLHEEDAPRVMEAVKASLAERTDELVIEYRVKNGDGWRWLQDRSRVIVDASGAAVGMLGIVLDVTETNENAARLAADQERFRLYSELSSDYVYEVDLRAGLAPTRTFGAFERTTGYTPEGVAAQGGWAEIIHPEDRGNIAELMGALDAGRAFINEYRIIRPDGDVRWLRDRARPIRDDANGAIVGLVGGVQDITEYKALEARLAHAEKLEALARLSGAVAHDFNNLLTIMMVASAMLPEPDGDETAQIAIEELRESLRRGAELTRSLLTFARRQPGERRVTVLADALELAMPIVTRAVGERVRVSLHQDVGSALVPIGQTQLEMILLNLAVNARDAMPDGGSLELHSRMTTFTMTDKERPPELAPATYATVEVRDTGAGIPGDVLPRVFEPFFTTKDAERGTGLGLASVHGVVRQLGGAVLVASVEGEGTTFTVHLPLTEGQPGTVDERHGRHAVGGTERIVVVEDEDDLRRTLARALEDLGYTVQGFGSAEHALADPAALTSCDLLLTDVRLPGMPGTELAVRAVEQRPSLRVVLMSGFVEDERQSAVIESCRFAFLEKPFVIEGLARRVREVLDDG